MTFKFPNIYYVSEDEMRFFSCIATESHTCHAGNALVFFLRFAESDDILFMQSEKRVHDIPRERKKEREDVIQPVINL